MIKPEDVTIIIPHLGGTPESEYSLEQCEISLRETVPDMKIVVATNGMKCEKGGGNIYIREQGQCKAVNAAVATTNTPWIFVTNDDMVFSERWFEDLTDTIEQQKLLCISPILVEPRPGAPTFEVEFIGGAGGDFRKADWDIYAKHRPIPVVPSIRTGFNLPFLIRRDVWDTVGGYDINYDPWGSNSDSDLEYKIKLAGIQPYQNTRSAVYHFSQTSGTFEPRNDEYRYKNFEYFKNKWGFDRTDDGIWEATFRIPTTEEGRIYTPVWEGKYGRLSQE